MLRSRTIGVRSRISFANGLPLSRSGLYAITSKCCMARAMRRWRSGSGSVMCCSTRKWATGSGIRARGRCCAVSPYRAGGAGCRWDGGAFRHHLGWSQRWDRTPMGSAQTGPRQGVQDAALRIDGDHPRPERFHYKEDTQLRMSGRPDLFHHTDESTLTV